MQLLKKDQNRIVAGQMVGEFIKGYDTVTKLTDAVAMGIIGTMYGKVERDERADVYLTFIKKLEARGIKPDVTQFNGDGGSPE